MACDELSIRPVSDNDPNDCIATDRHRHDLPMDASRLYPTTDKRIVPIIVDGIDAVLCNFHILATFVPTSMVSVMLPSLRNAHLLPIYAWQQEQEQLEDSTSQARLAF